MFRERDVDERKCVLLKIPRCDIDGVKGSDRNFEASERRWVLLKILRCDIDGLGEGK